MKSIYFRNFLISSGLVIICFLVLAVAFVVMGRSSLVKEKRDNMAATALGISETTKIYYIEEANLAFLGLKMNLSQVARITGLHIFITNTNGVVENCSDDPYTCEHIGALIPAGIMHSLTQSPREFLISDLGGYYKTKNYVTAVPVIAEAAERAVAYVFVATEVAALLDAWEAFLVMFSVTAVLVMLTAVLMAFITSKQQSRPINEMAHAARQFAHGSFSVRVTEDPRRRDEIGELTSSFNAMAVAMERSEELRREFVANVSHELKTPMTTISGFADGILDGTIPAENQNKYLKIISDETKRLSRLVRSMLELSRIQSDAGSDVLKMDFDITETIRRALVNFESKINGRGLDVDIQIPENSIIALGDGDAIMQVVYNLLDNAIKFSERGTTLGVSLWRQNGKAYVSVKNSGETIPPEELAQIFERFHKTDRSRSLDRDGVGLGLHIVKTILNKHNEDISASSRDGETEFVFSLTLKPQTGRHAQAQRISPPPSAEPEEYQEANQPSPEPGKNRAEPPDTGTV